MNVRPSDWAPTRLGDVLTFQVGFPFRSEYFVTVPLGPRLIRNRDLRSDDSIVHYNGRYSKDYIVEPGDVLVGMDGDFSPCVWPTGQALLNQRVGRLRVSQRACSRFLAYALAGPLKALEGATGATTVKHLSHRDVESIVLPLPATAEQERIASALESADAVIDALRISISKKQAIKQGMMQELLSGHIRLPGFCAPWQDVRLGDHVAYVKTVPLSRAQLDQTSPLRYLHYGDIHTYVGVTLDASAEPMPRAPTALAGKAGRLNVGDLVFADASEDPAGVGRSVEITAVPSEGVVPGLHTIAARFDKNVLADGFKAYLQFIPSFRESLLRLAAGTKVLATTRTFISSITLPLPPADEQTVIASVLADVEAEIAALRRRLVKARAIKQGMMQELLTGRTRLSAAEDAA